MQLYGGPLSPGGRESHEFSPISRAIRPSPRTQLSLYICNGNKASGQLHFKYHTDVKENVQQDKCLEFRILWEEMCFAGLPRLRNIEPWRVCSPFCPFGSIARNSIMVFIMGMVLGVCVPVHFFFYHSLMKCPCFEGGEKSLLFFWRDCGLPHTHRRLTGAVPA